jgi:hypothetical protein
LCPCCARHTRGGGDAEQTQVVYIPLKTTPGLGPPRTRNGAWIQLSYVKCRMNDDDRIIPAAARSGGGQIEQGHPGRGRPFAAPSSFASVLLPSCLVLFLANFLAGTLAGECGFYALFLTRLQVKGVALDLLDNVFLLHFALKTAQSILEGFPLLQSNFRQTRHTPKPVRKDRFLGY